MNGDLSLPRRLKADALWALTGKAMASGGMFAISLLVARLLPPELVGGYFLGFSLASAGAVLARLGLEKGALTLVAARVQGRRSELPRLVRTIVVAVLTASAILGSSLVLFGRPLLEQLSAGAALDGTLHWLAIWLALLAVEELLSEVFRGLHRIREASLLGGAMSRGITTLALFGIVLVTGTSHLSTVLAITVFGLLLVSTLGGLRLWRALEPLTSDEPDDFDLGQLWGVGAPLLLSNLSYLVIGHADVLILAAFRPESEVALYALGSRLVIFIGFPLAVANAILPPLMSQMRDSPDRLQSIVRGTATLAGLPAATILLLLILVPGPILSVVYGPYYSAAAAVLTVLCVGQAANVLTGSCGYLLIMMGYHRDLMWITLASGFVILSSALTLVNDFGALGVAVATAVGTVIQQVATLGCAHRRCGVWTHARVPRRADVHRLIDLWHS